MKSLLEALRSNMLIQAILSLVLGLFLVIWPDSTTITLVYIFAAYLALIGAVSLIAYFRSNIASERSPFSLGSGVFTLVVALIMFIFPEAVAGFFSFILGILLAVAGIVNTIRSVELRSYHDSSWIATLVMSIIMAVGGIVIVVNPFATTTLFMWVLGGLLILKGLADLVIERGISRALKQLR